jgi:hypothetical protein
VQAYSWWGYWVWVAFMTICAVLLLVAPVRIAGRRDRSRRPIAFTLVVTGFLLTVLVIGAIASIDEVLGGPSSPDAATFLVRLASVIVIVWAFWAAVLYWLTRNQTPDRQRDGGLARSSLAASSSCSLRCPATSSSATVTSAVRACIPLLVWSPAFQ